MFIYKKFNFVTSFKNSSSISCSFIDYFIISLQFSDWINFPLFPRKSRLTFFLEGADQAFLLMIFPFSFKLISSYFVLLELNAFLLLELIQLCLHVLISFI